MPVNSKVYRATVCIAGAMTYPARRRGGFCSFRMLQDASCPPAAQDSATDAVEQPAQAVRHASSGEDDGQPAAGSPAINSDDEDSEPGEEAARPQRRRFGDQVSANRRNSYLRSKLQTQKTKVGGLYLKPSGTLSVSRSMNIIALAGRSGTVVCSE